MQFEDVIRSVDLPPLAWSLDVGTHRLTAGEWVEVEDGACFEGARSSRSGLLDATGYVFGSGAVRQPDGYVCVPPTHTLDGLYVVVRHTGGATVTNSLVWALRTAGVTATHAPRFRELTTALRTATHGLPGYKRLLLPLRGVSVLQFLHSPFLLRRDGLTERPLAFPRQTQLDFATYKAALVDVVRRTLDYSPRYSRLLSTCSSGYDSPACAAVGKEVGLDLALTVTSGRGAQDDSGARPAREMGLPVEAYERPGNGLERYSGLLKDWFVDLETVAEATGEDFSEFIGAFANNGDVYFKPFEPHLTGSVLLTGFHGAIWDFMSGVGPWIRRGDTSGSGLNEFRLRVGFVHLPLPYVEALQAPAIERLSQSREMIPWRYGNPYNRPIPRRLAEEAGAGRESFGRKKRAANVLVQTTPAGQAEAYERMAARYA